MLKALQLPLYAYSLLVSWLHGLTLMVVLRTFATGSCDIATRYKIVGAKFTNGHINFRLGHFDIFSFQFSSAYFTL